MLSLRKVYRYHKAKLLLVVLLFTASILYIQHYAEGVDSNSRYPTILKTVKARFLLENKQEDIGNIRLKVKATHVPVVIVDQHQEVVPYWFKAVGEEIIPRQGNTLIHIDGHSDMAPPDSYKFFQKFKYLKNMKESDYYPLMQSNDVFIASSAMVNLINKVIWVQPDWNENYTEITSAYVGVGNFAGKQQTCTCQRQIHKRKVRLAKQKRSPYECSYAARDSDDEGDQSIDPSECKKVKEFKFYTTTESRFQKIFNFKSHKNIIVDIDEDYFGVESGVQTFIDQGISLKTQEVLDSLLSNLYCPNTTVEEVVLNRALQGLFFEIYQLRQSKRINSEHQFRREIEKQTSTFLCNKKELNEFALFLSLTDIQELKAMSNVRYCLLNSPRLQKMMSMKDPGSENEMGFSLCHGNIFPGDKLNKIHVGSTKEIQQRSTKMNSILSHISSFTKPKLFTVCRSLRDGYTPRRQQTFIEESLLSTLANVINSNQQNMNIIYDPQLVFGKKGWTMDRL